MHRFEKEKLTLEKKIAPINRENCILYNFLIICTYSKFENIHYYMCFIKLNNFQLKPIYATCKTNRESKLTLKIGVFARD